MTDKAIVILDNFWNANYLINSGFAIFPYDKDKFYKVNLSQRDKNYTVYSIALRHPALDEKLPHLRNLDTLSFFCPTYNMLNRYKEDGDWDAYTKDYKNLLRKRRQEIQEWINSLTPNHVYILCCWENTSLKAKCHRQILYEAFNSSKLAKEKILSFYCSGEKKMNVETANPLTFIGAQTQPDELFGALPSNGGFQNGIINQISGYTNTRDYFGDPYPTGPIRPSRTRRAR